MFGFKSEMRGRGGRHWCGPSEGGEGRGRSGFSKGPWGRGGRGAGGGEGRGPGRGRRMFGPGDLRLVLLALVEQEPRHGYDLIKAIETAFGGGYAPSPGVVYPTLSLLADEGLIAGVEDSTGKRVFSVTEAGKAWLDENRAAVDGVMQRMAQAARLVSGEQTPEVVREAFHTLRHAVQMKPGGWSDPETAKVVEALMKAVREISGE
ncbi:PadR family transcriptional regulator [Brevundimonas sp.]|jgi:DNA-binding PadR family transcriptional regulator|uniref:PadR family transcriptional regulator n=1 Tax=Brevundimonas sp. TaxID=1871086 RepID=UPI003783266E